MKNPRACDYCKEYRVRCVRLADGACKECRANREVCQFRILPKKRGPKPRAAPRASSEASHGLDPFVHYTGAEILGMSRDAIDECLALLCQKYADPALLHPIREVLVTIRSTPHEGFWAQLPAEVAAVLRSPDAGVSHALIYALAALGHALARHPSAVLFYETALDAAQFLHPPVPIVTTLLNACYDQLNPPSNP